MEEMSRRAARMREGDAMGLGVETSAPEADSARLREKGVGGGDRRDSRREAAGPAVRVLALGLRAANARMDSTAFNRMLAGAVSAESMIAFPRLEGWRWATSVNSARVGRR